MLMLGRNLRSDLSMSLLDDDVAAPCSKVTSRSKERNYMHEAFTLPRSTCKPLQTARKHFVLQLDNAPRLQSDLK